MDRFIYENSRTHRCGSLTESEIGQDVVLMGWVHTQRNLGGFVFVDLRDREGITQVVFDPQANAETHRAAGDLRSEWVIAVAGKVRSRGENINPKMKTGAIEVAATRLEVLNQAKTPPFLIEDEIDSSEELRLRHRFLDLRRGPLQRNLIMRHRFNQVVRRSLDAQGFLELETPFLIKSTPEGARDYVVPSRVHGGSFFALPQSPQLFKQLFMMSGFDRYFQIVRCFRDEDLRAERQPEFTQVDVEMSFCAPDDVISVVEELISQVWKELLGIELEIPFERMPYDEAMDRYGVDAPDLRFGLELKDISDLVAGVGFKVFAQTVESGGVVKGINLRGVGNLSRKDLDHLPALVTPYGAKGIAWVRIKEGGEWQGPIAKFFDDERKRSVAARMDLGPGDVAVFVADQAKVVNASLGNLRKQLARQRGLVPERAFRFCWVVDFPAFDYDDESERYYAAHHPFTAPKPEFWGQLEKDPASVKAQAYDLVLNGVEIAGGSIRIHDRDLQEEVFRALGIGAAEAQDKFGFLLNALQYGAPPHGGIALGADRIMMLLCGTSSIRDVIAFPKTQRQTDLMLAAPSSLDDEQLRELSIQISRSDDRRKE